MRKFNKSLIGYNTEEVNFFIDGIIKKMESIINENKYLMKDNSLKDKRISELEDLLNLYNDNSKIDNNNYKNYYEGIAKNESNAIINEAKKNANRIISEALDRANKEDEKASLLHKNIKSCKDRIRKILNEEIDLLDEFDNNI